jgi:signal transduction histidine kinase
LAESDRTGDVRSRVSAARLALQAAGALITATPVKADAQDASMFSLPSVPPAETNFAGVVILLLMLFATITAILHLVGRRVWTRRVGELEGELAKTRAALDRAALFLRSDPQILIAWDRSDAEPSIEGDFALVADAPLPRRILAFASWLDPATASHLEGLIDRLLKRGEAFSIAAATLKGRHIEIDGRAVSGSAVARIRDVSGDRLQLARIRDAQAETEAALTSHRLLLDALNKPAWTRGVGGELEWANLAYVGAVEAPDREAVVARHIELFDRAVRQESASTLQEAGLWRRRAPALVAGERRTFDVVEVRTPTGFAGLAADLSEIVGLRLEMERHSAAYSRLIDQIPTAVAVFDRAKRLTLHNAAYRQIWSLDPAFLEQKPTDGEILDRLRAKRQLPEQADFRSWKAQLMSAYQAIEPTETVWYLPDGRALRVVMSPNPQGGVTYLYDDATQSYALASQVQALTHVQGETLDALKEGVAVFGADGRLKLINPTFAELWRLDGKRAVERPHIDEIVRDFLPLCPDHGLWDGLRAIVVGLPEHRANFEMRVERSDGLILDCAALSLPDGATLLTFLDVTAGANVERALTERNQALVAAEKLRNDFVNHVSYELRTPLTNIIGFTQFLAAGGVGPLNPKQLEYAGFITNSSHALLAIIDDILDIASIDAGALELRLEDVDVAEAMKAAAAGVQDRLREASIELRIVVTDGVGSLRADGRRVRQVLFNLLSNAIGFSEPGQTVTLAAMRRGDEIVFKVSDRGRGIPPEMLDRVFERFESFPNGSRHRGPGLGLSIVRALVELHGGKVLIDTAPNEGTTVTSIFPIAAEARTTADHAAPAARLAGP